MSRGKFGTKNCNALSDCMLVEQLFNTGVLYLNYALLIV